MSLKRLFLNSSSFPLKKGRATRPKGVSSSILDCSEKEEGWKGWHIAALVDKR
jgi:hypothetical protein